MIAGYTNHLGGACTACAAGSYKPSYGTHPCTPCQRGKFSTTDTGTSESVCTSCPVNSDSVEGSFAASSCTCNKGYYLSSSVCTLCAVGMYKSTQSDAACSSCPLGSSTLSTGSEGSSQCTCNAGKYGPMGGSCNECPAGSWCSGSVDHVCPYNSDSSAGSIAITDCGKCPHIRVCARESCVCCFRTVHVCTAYKRHFLDLQTIFCAREQA